MVQTSLAAALMERYFEYKSKWRSFETDPPDVGELVIIKKGETVCPKFIESKKDINVLSSICAKWIPLPKE